jgi:hypothetical protein
VSADDLGTALGLLIVGGTLLLVTLIALRWAVEEALKLCRWVLTRWPSAALVTGSASPPPVSQDGQVASVTRGGQGGSTRNDHINRLGSGGHAVVTIPAPDRSILFTTVPSHSMDLNDPGSIWTGGPQRPPHWTDVQ